ncbi:hypothetical protein ACFQ0T_13995 [Kitasatospora gansuensis]
MGGGDRPGPHHAGRGRHGDRPPLWGGLTLRREGGSSPTLDLTAATAEAYLDRRYPGDYTATATDMTTVMADLATAVLTSGPPLVLDTAASGTVIDYTMADSADRTVSSGLQEVAAMAGAPEWTIDVAWADAAQTRFQLILRIRPTLGVVTDRPAAIFDMPGCLSSYVVSESYERGKGATRTIARGAQADGTRATSAVHTAAEAIAAGWPLWEDRFTPAAGITDTGQLDRHAAQALALSATGARAWALQATASRAPRLGSEWGLGDSIGIQIASSPRHPAGTAVTARAYAWALDTTADSLVPTLLEDE